MKIFKTVTDVWTISETQELFGLTLTETGKIVAPEGKQVTLVYNGENLPLLPGQYEGDVILEVTENCPYQGSNLRAAVVLEDGKYQPQKSVTAMAIGGEVADNRVSGVSISSMEEAVNGIYASIPEGGEAVIENVTIDMIGNGGNDFIGYGAAIAAAGKGKLTVNCSDITTHGAARGAIYAGENIRLEVNDSKIKCRGGVLNADYEDTIKTTLPGVMRRVPWMLGLRGNNRATNLLDYADATYNRCDLSTDGWGVMSTDGVKRCRLYVNDSNVEIKGKSGYGALSIGDCVVTYNNSTVKAADYGLIMLMGKGSGVFKNGANIVSKRFGTMSSLNTGLLECADSTITSEKTTFLVKGCSTEFRVENSKLQPGNGIILQVMNSDDPGNPKGHYCDPAEPDEKIVDRDLTTAVAGTDVVATFTNMQMTGDMYNGSCETAGDTGGANLLAGGPGAGAPGGGMPPMENFPAPGGDFPAMPGGFPTPGGDFPAMPGGGMPPMGDFPAPGGDMPQMPGGFSMPSFGGPNVKNLSITLKNSSITGRITASVSKHRVEKVCKECCEELGEVDNFPEPAINNGVIVSLDENSTWTVTEESYLTALTLAPGAALQSAAGGAPRLLVDGVETEIAAGTYTGAIAIRP